jgi:hypothetical protein
MGSASRNAEISKKIPEYLQLSKMQQRAEKNEAK